MAIKKSLSESGAELLESADNELLAVLCGDISKIRGRDFVPKPIPKDDIIIVDDFRLVSRTKTGGPNLTFLTDSRIRDEEIDAYYVRTKVEHGNTRKRSA
jgi:hypothetical protein